MSKRLIRIVAPLATLAAALLVAAPSAGATSGPVVAKYKLAPGAYNLATGLDAVWAVNADEVHDAQLYRIDPRSHGMKLVTTLSFPAGGIAVAYGSIWVSDYFGNAVWRLDSNGQVQAEIGVGLQPQFLHAAFGSMWSSNHHDGSLTRIDPATNTVEDTIPVGAPDSFRDGPLQMTDDGTNLYVASADLTAIQLIDPTTDTVTTGPPVDDGFCGDLAAIGGYVWSADSVFCSDAFYRLGADGSELQSIPAAGATGGLTVLNGQLWVTDDTTFDPNTFTGSDAVAEQLDPATGAVLRTVPIGADASDVVGGFGDLWVYDSVAGTIRRVTV
jgi:YVTN family beta-propeller protein